MLRLDVRLVSLSVTICRFITKTGLVVFITGKKFLTIILEMKYASEHDLPVGFILILK